MSSPRALLRLCSRQAQLFSAPRSAAAPARRVHTASRHQSQLRQHQAFLPQIHHRRAFSCTCAPRDSKDNPNAPPVHVGAKPDVDPDVPAYNLTFTCRVCTTRSAHRITKQGYHEGTVLVSCPGCKNRHLISDHLKVFQDQSVSLEDILKQASEGRREGVSLKRGALSSDGDLELWDDGTATPRKDALKPEARTPTEPNNEPYGSSFAKNNASAENSENKK
ncbi:DNL zinc finger-domain-containing protein [Phyllosticta capitalensis]|uniref:DNL zinc finger-domain-containing protein n=1 Tax=Phyllosticta capitalensis TaxID=121624 RepID=A0ABR1YF83_9PEZI